VPSAVVYIDGFSLYYGAVRRTPYRWLNVAHLADEILDEDEVLEVRYYVARDPQPDKYERQATYMRALETIDRLTLHEIPAADPVTKLGEDVIERADLIGRDAISLVISDDGRLAPHVSTSWEAHRHTCGVASPSGHFHPELLKAAGFKKRVRRRVLMACLLPDIVVDHNGTEIRKPDDW
jgi:hypothetical protein